MRGGWVGCDYLPSSRNHARRCQVTGSPTPDAATGGQQGATFVASATGVTASGGACSRRRLPLGQHCTCHVPSQGELALARLRERCNLLRTQPDKPIGQAGMRFASVRRRDNPTDRAQRVAGSGPSHGCPDYHSLGEKTHDTQQESASRTSSKYTRHTRLCFSLALSILALRMRPWLLCRASLSTLLVVPTPRWARSDGCYGSSRASPSSYLHVSRLHVVGDASSGVKS